jgi:hypothetical protein
LNFVHIVFNLLKELKVSIFIKVNDKRFDIETSFSFLAAKRKQCSDVTCTMYCEHGFKVDENGCDICECNDARES